MINLEKVEPASGRCVAVVGDTMADVVGKPLHESAALVWNCVDQPSGSDLFSGLGTGGNDVPFTSLGSATFTHSGFHAFTVASANGSIARVEAVCFPAAALTVDRIKYASLADKNANAARAPHEIRGSLRALALHATKSGIETTLESATSAPFHGTNPVTLGASTNVNYVPFGGW